MAEKETVRAKETWYDRYVLPFYKYAVLLLILLLIISVISDIFDRCYYIQSIESNTFMTELNISADEVTSRIKDEMDMVYEQAHSLKGLHPNITNLTNPFDVDLGGLSTSYFTLVNFIKGKIGRPNTNITGTVYHDGLEYCLRTRIGDELIDDQCITFDSTQTKIEIYNDIMHRQALGIVGHSDPYISAMFHYKQGKYEECIQLAKASIEQDVAVEKYAIGTIANSYREMGEYALAEQYYKESLKKFPKFYPSYWQYGRLLVLQKQYSKAETQFRHVAEKDPAMKKAALVSLLELYCATNQTDAFQTTKDQYLEIGQQEVLSKNDLIVNCL